MEKIIWWWNVVYYFFVKWYTKVGDVIHLPFKFFLKNSFVNEFYKRRGVDDIEKTVKNAVKQAQIAETYIELFLSGLLSFPLMGLSWIINMLLNRYKVMDGITFFLIGITVSAVIVFFPLQNYLLGKNDRYKKYFKEFDNMFKNSVAEKRLYGLLVLLTIIGLIGLGIFEFYIGGEIMKLNNAQSL